MGWDIYFIGTGKEPTREEILKNEKYKEKIIEDYSERERPVLYITYKDSDGAEHESGLLMEYSKGKLFYGTGNYGMDALPICRELYHDFGFMPVEEGILYFNEDIAPYKNKLTQEEKDLLWEYRVIHESYWLGVIDEPNDWIKDKFSKLPQYMDIIHRYNMDLNNLNILAPSYDVMRKHDEERDATYKKRKKEARLERRRHDIYEIKDRLRQFFKHPFEEYCELPF